jgi:hypothetical protein
MTWRGFVGLSRILLTFVQGHGRGDEGKSKITLLYTFYIDFEKNNNTENNKFCRGFLRGFAQRPDQPVVCRSGDDLRQN